MLGDARNELLKKSRLRVREGRRIDRKLGSGADRGKDLFRLVHQEVESEVGEGEEG